MRPTKLCLELSGACNLRCNMCPSSKGGVSKSLMSPKILDLIPVELIQNGVKSLQVIKWVNLFGFGEAFLNPQWKQFAKRFYKYGRTTFIETNGMAIDFSEPYIKLPYITQIGFSVDGYWPETNDKYRVGASLEFIKKNIKALREKRPDIYIRIVFCGRISNIEEFVLMPSFCKEVGANELKFVHMIAYSEDQAKDILYYEKSKTDACLIEGVGGCENKGIRINIPAGMYKDYTGKPACVRPEKQMFIKNDGAVKVCMLHDEVIGNLYKQDFYGIWNSDKYQEFRETVNTPKAIGLCGNCPEYDSMDIMDEKAYLQFERKL